MVEKTSLYKTFPYVAGICLPLLASAAQLDPNAKPSVEVSSRAANRKMKDYFEIKEFYSNSFSGK